MVSRAHAVALLALLVVLAGCGGLGGGPADETARTTTPSSTSTSTATATATDAITTTTPTADATTTPTPTTAREEGTADRYPPGVTADGVVGAMALAEAHAAHLRDGPYTTNETVVSRFENGTLARRIDQVTHRNDSAHRRTYRVSGPLRDVDFRRLDVWDDGTEHRSRWTLVNGTVQYRGFPGPSGSARDASDWMETIYGRLGSGTFVVEETDGSGPARYRLVSSGLETDGGEDATLELLVDERGFVHEYRYAYDRAMEGTTVHTVQTVRFSGLGETTIERPPWYEAAVNATGG